jgi:hypothetical protein
VVLWKMTRGVRPLLMPHLSCNYLQHVLLLLLSSNTRLVVGSHALLSAHRQKSGAHAVHCPIPML